MTRTQRRKMMYSILLYRDKPEKKPHTIGKTRFVEDMLRLLEERRLKA